MDDMLQHLQQNADLGRDQNTKSGHEADRKVDSDDDEADLDLIEGNDNVFAE